jgi:hypothetical protein
MRAGAAPKNRYACDLLWMSTNWGNDGEEATGTSAGNGTWPDPGRLHEIFADDESDFSGSGSVTAASSPASTAAFTTAFTTAAASTATAGTTGVIAAGRSAFARKTTEFRVADACFIGRC